MTATNEAETKVWIDAIQKKLQESIQNKITDLVIAYGDVSKAFPNYLHPDTHEGDKLNFQALKKWVKELGWNVQIASEYTQAEEQNKPPIRFTQIR